jgi:hypothetical protein
MRMTIADPRPVLGRDHYAVTRGTGILRRSRQFLREAGALIVRCLQQAGTPATGIGRIGDHRGPPRTGRAEPGWASGETPRARRRAMRGRGGTPRRHARPQSQSGRSYAERPAADSSGWNQPSDPPIARLLRQHAFRIAHSADPVDALAGVIDLVIDSDADPYHLIGVLAEGAVQTLAHRISSERRRDTAMALVQLMLDRLQFGRME